MKNKLLIGYLLSFALLFTTGLLQSCGSKKETVVVAMSGGVDSTVCAALMAEKHNVIGVTLQLYDYGQSK